MLYPPNQTDKLKEGDANSHFFHSARRRSNRISHVRIEDNNVEEIEERFMASFIFQIKLLTPIGLLNDTSPLLTWRPNLDCAWQQLLPWYRWYYSILFQVFLAHCGASCVYGYEQQYASSMEGDIDCPKTNNADCPENPISLCQSTYKIVVF